MRFFFLILCIFLFLTVFNLNAQAPVKQVGAVRAASSSPHNEAYRLSLSASYEETGYTLLHLSNGTVWKHASTGSLPLSWLVGDQLLIEQVGQTWKLNNLTYQGSATVQFVRLAHEMLPTIQKIEQLGGKIFLEDGSEWQIGFWSRYAGFSWSWKVGDRIIISPLAFPSENTSHLLINLDRQMHSLPGLLIKF